jgi:hypothetical protein
MIPGRRVARREYTRRMEEHLDIGFSLDRRWHLLRGEMERSKKPTLLLLGRVLAEAEVKYAIIGGVALQIHQDEPRTTLDIDLAVLDRAAIPAARLLELGFRQTGTYPHSENWVGPEATPVQFTDDPALSDAILRAGELYVEGVRLRVIGKADLVREKLRACRDPARRRSKRIQDLADVQALIEQDASLEAALSEEDRRWLANAAP